jgi:fructosamine-3-kinase
MHDDRHSGLKKAYSSKLRIEEREGKEVIIKEVGAQEAQSELFFQHQLKSIGLPFMEAEFDAQGLAVTFIPDAQTLGDDETPELYKRLGIELRKVHNVTFDAPFFVDADGQRRKVTWSQFIENDVESAVVRQKERNGLDVNVVKQSTQIVLKKTTAFAGKSSLLHGDLHANNVLVKGSDLFIFDKADQIMAGNAMYDLSLFAITLPGALYGIGDNITRDKALLAAFIEGYGSDFTTNRDLLDAYVLLRCLERWPNPFEQEIPTIVKSILSN